MSVYCLGKLKGPEEECRSFLQTAATDARLNLSFDLDPEDEEVLNEPEDLKGEGVAFRVSSGPGDSDVVKVWNATREVGLTKLRMIEEGSDLPDCQTDLRDFDLPEPVRLELAEASLGKFASTITRFQQSRAGGLAFFDGSIRQIIPASPERCLRHILTAFLVPWDCGPDALYVWNQGRCEPSPKPSPN
jgi:hypothetical protein